VLRIAQDVVEQEVEEGLLLLREDGAYLLLNRTGAAIWQGLREGEEAGSIAQRLADLPGAPDEEACRAATRDFVAELAKAGFVREQR
jgi:hypothetical protein